MRRVSGTLCIAAFALVTAMSAQAQMGPPAPAPELKKLDFLVGDWTSEGTMNPAPGFPGGKFTSSDHIEWMQGNFFRVSNGTFDFASMGKGKNLAVFGYDSDHKVYTYTEFNSMGEADVSTGTVDGDTWTWTSDEHMGGMTMKGRFTMKVLSPTSYTMKFELSPDGATWNTGMEGKATKK